MGWGTIEREDFRKFNVGSKVKYKHRCRFVKFHIKNVSSKGNEEQRSDPVNREGSLLEVVSSSLENTSNDMMIQEIFKMSLDQRGIYCLRCNNPQGLPYSYKVEFDKNEHDLLYIGIAQGQTLEKRLEQELLQKGTGTLFRSLGAMLGFQPERGSLYGKSNQNNYRFNKRDQKAIIDWIHLYLTVQVFKMKRPKKLEKILILKYRPLLNLQHNPTPSIALQEARRQCRDRARIRVDNESIE